MTLRMSFQKIPLGSLSRLNKTPLCNAGPCGYFREQAPDQVTFTWFVD